MGGFGVFWGSPVERVLSHPMKIAWNLKGGLLKRTVVHKGPLLRFHVCFPEWEVGDHKIGT